MRLAELGIAVLLLNGCSGYATAPSASPSTLRSHSLETGSAIGAPTAGGVADPTPSGHPPAAPAWRADWSEEPFPGSVQGVAVDGDRLIVVGKDSEGLAAWISSDASSWQRHPVPDPTIDTPIADGWGMGPIVRMGATLFSFGTLRGGGDSRRPVAWRSSDGVGWEFIESSSEFYQSGGIAGVVASDSGLVAVTEGGLIAPYQTAWRWTADTSWEKSDLASTRDRPLVIHDLVWNGETYLAVGARYDPLNAERWWESLEPTLWRSNDGQSWTPLALPSGLGRGCAVAATVDGFLLIGLGADGPHVWSSTDGSDWSMIGPVGETRDATCWDGLTAVHGGFVALRNTGDALVLSTSGDGAAWSDSELPGLSSALTLLAVLGDRVVLFAHQPSGEGTAVVLRSARH